MPKSKPVKQSVFQQIYNTWWKHLIGAVLTLALAYVTASWAIDSGRLLVYALTLFLLGRAVWHVVMAVKTGRHAA